MRLPFLVCGSFSVLLPLLAAISTAGQGSVGSSAPPLFTRRTTTRVVVVDVVVRDKDGKPVTNLVRDNFRIFEDGVEQTIASFALQRPAPSQRGSLLVPPADSFASNRPEFNEPAGPPTILLVDLLNTPIQDQAYALPEVIRYLEQEPLESRQTAILMLSRHLHVLQDFTSDPALLRAAVAKLKPQVGSAELGDEQPMSETFQFGTAFSAEEIQVMPQLQRVLSRAEQAFVRQRVNSLEDRVNITLGALRAIARTLMGYPGRKNLVWVSAAFPLSIQADDLSELPFDLVTTFAPEVQSDRLAEQTKLSATYVHEIRHVGALLTNAQIAIYPVDARGLGGYRAANASERGTDILGRGVGSDIADRLGRKSGLLVSSHHAMEQIAEDTGGRAFFNTNDLAAAIAQALADGSAYYTLSYSPLNKTWDGKFRRIRVRLDRSGLQVAHRQGYFATEEHQDWRRQPRARDTDLTAALTSPLLARGVTFWARVAPPIPAAPAANRARVPIEFRVDIPTIDFEIDATGRRLCNLDFLAVAYSAEGQPAGSVSHTVDAKLRPDQVPSIEQHGFPYRLELELPSGRYQLRLLVRDNHTGRLGTVATAVDFVVN